MKKKKENNLKGFTLIELLAVIVILAVIALIAVPQVLKILNKARLSSAEDSIYGIVESAETYVSNFMLQNSGAIPSGELEFNCSSDGCNLQTALDGYNLEGLEKLEFKGSKPKSGTIKISNNGSDITVSNLNMNGFNCNYPIDENVVCNKNDDIKNNNYVSNNLLVRYNYEDSSNTNSILKDLSGNGNDGQIFGATYGDGLVFDGVDDYVAIDEINNHNLTWEVSFKISNNGEAKLISNSETGGEDLSLKNNHLFASIYIDRWNEFCSNNNIELNKLYFATFVYNGNLMKLYVNGILESQIIINGSIKDPDDNTILMLGANPSGNKPVNSFLDGSIYSVRIYDRALNETEIKYNYEIDKARYQS